MSRGLAIDYFDRYFQIINILQLFPNHSTPSPPITGDYWQFCSQHCCRSANVDYFSTFQLLFKCKLVRCCGPASFFLFQRKQRVAKSLGGCPDSSTLSTLVVYRYHCTRNWALSASRTWRTMRSNACSPDAPANSSVIVWFSPRLTLLSCLSTGLSGVYKNFVLWIAPMTPE